MFYLAEPLSRQRKAVSDMQWDSSIEEVKEIAAKDFDLPLEDVVLVYRGRLMKNGKKLEDYSVKNRSTIHVLPRRKEKAAPSEVESMETEDVNDLTAQLRPTPLEVQAVVSEIVSDSGFLQYVIMNSASLSSNPQVQELIRNSDFLEKLGNPDEVQRLLQMHPNLMRAAQNALGEWLSMQEENTMDGTMRAEERDEGEPSHQQQQQQQQFVQQAPPRHITPEDVAAAVASAQRSLGAPPPLPPRPRRRPPQQQQPAAISVDMVRQAVAQAMTRSPMRRWETQLIRLREMGITDEAACIQALEATGGDVEAALNLLMS
ncbi:ubiquitin-like protein 7 [Oscarella lobularis]|uniref:ubiquitin-like protein 7 n=1 Tax=Oscarella lobularis TaxID=121494 RepID=UPI0033133E38